MNNTAYVISATYGEYDDFNSIPLFVCLMDVERDLFIDSLENHESPYYYKVVEYFHKNYPSMPIESCVPHDIGFSWEEVEILSLLDVIVV